MGLGMPHGMAWHGMAWKGMECAAKARWSLDGIAASLDAWKLWAMARLGASEAASWR